MTIESYDYEPSASCKVQVARFVAPDAWFWREKWLGAPVSQWRGPFPTKQVAEHEAGINVTSG